MNALTGKIVNCLCRNIRGQFKDYKTKKDERVHFSCAVVFSFDKKGKLLMEEDTGCSTTAPIGFKP